MKNEDRAPGIPKYYDESEIKKPKKTATTVLADASFKYQPRFNKPTEVSNIDEFMAGPFNFGK